MVKVSMWVGGSSFWIHLEGGAPHNIEWELQNGQVTQQWHPTNGLFALLRTIRAPPPVARKASKKCKGGSGVKGTQICSSVLGIYVHSAYFSRERKPRTHNVSYIQKDFQNSRKIELKPIFYAAPEFFKSMHAMGFQKAHENMYDKKAWISTNFLEHPCV